MVYHLIDSDDEHPEWCTRLNSDGVGPFDSIYLIYGIINVVSFAVLVWWAHSQYLAKTSGYYTPDAVIIFPIYLKMLVFTAFTAIAQSLLFASLYYAGVTEEWLLYDITQGFSWGLYHVAIEGTTMLLLCRGIGMRSMKKAIKVGLSYGCFTMICIFLWFNSKTTSQTHRFISESAGDIVYYIWTLTQLVIYLGIWLMPNRGIFTRRPASVYWSRFLGSLRFGFTICSIFNVLKYDFAYCVNHFLGGLIFCGFRTWVTYRVFFLDTCWWHGIPVEVPLCYGARIMDTVGKGGGGGEGPLEGVELTGASALAMSSVMDDIERERTGSAPNSRVRGESSSKLMSRLRGRTDPESQEESRVKKVPLLDFSRLIMNSSQMLGVGSTARVYAGSWCGKKCAIKVLFTVEIVPEEIKRICIEASLLHNLQHASENVIGLYGVAILPPCLCIVLELCSEGSLSDVLYNKHEESHSSSSSTLTNIDRKKSTERLSSDQIWNLHMSEKVSPSSNKSTAGSSFSPLSNYKYRLLWEDRLDLMLGCCEGLAAFAKGLPGYSHNDIKSANYLVHDILTDVNRPQRRSSHNKYNDINTDRNVKKNFVVKIADLEMVSAGVTPEHLHRPGCVANWTAPEVLSGTNPVSPVSDVFSLAMTLYEIMTRSVPFAGENAAKRYVDGDRPKFYDSSTTDESNLASSESEKSPEEIVSKKLVEALIIRAWSQDPNDRPDILSLTEEIKVIAKDFKMTKQRQNLNRRATFKGNVLKNEAIRTSTSTPIEQHPNLESE